MVAKKIYADSQNEAWLNKTFFKLEKIQLSQQRIVTTYENIAMGSFKLCSSSEHLSLNYSTVHGAL